MEQLIKLLNEFETRNNVSTTLTVYADGSGTLHEFWKDDVMFSFENPEELIKYLTETEYELTDGFLTYPLKIKTK